MSEKFSIITIDTNKLNEKICNYIYKTGETNPYIFMSKDTIVSFLEELEPCLGVYLAKDSLGKARLNGKIGLYEGHKVFEDNDLSFGEVEVR